MVAGLEDQALLSSNGVWFCSGQRACLIRPRRLCTVGPRCDRHQFQTSWLVIFVMAACTVATACFPTSAPTLSTIPVSPCWPRSPATYLNLPMIDSKTSLDPNSRSPSRACWRIGRFPGIGDPGDLADPIRLADVQHVHAAVVGRRRLQYAGNNRRVFKRHGEEPYDPVLFGARKGKKGAVSVVRAFRRQLHVVG